MPLYEYECQACGKRFELIQKFSDPPAEVCRLCAGGPVQRLLSSPAIQFKGSGWYITDYAKKDTGGAKADAARAGKKDGDAAPAAAPAASPSSGGGGSSASGPTGGSSAS